MVRRARRGGAAAALMLMAAACGPVDAVGVSPGSSPATARPSPTPKPSPTPSRTPLKFSELVDRAIPHLGRFASDAAALKERRDRKVPNTTYATAWIVGAKGTVAIATLDQGEVYDLGMVAASEAESGQRPRPPQFLPDPPATPRP